MSETAIPDGATTAPPARPQRTDLTQGPILRTLALFAAPTLLSNVLQSLNGSINTIWVGRLIGESALAATANANIVMFLVFSAIFGFGMAAIVRIGQSFGARDVEAARRTFGTVIGLTVVLALLVGVLGWLFAPRLLALLGTPADARALALAYLRVIFVSLPAGMVSVVISMGLRGSGDSRSPLYFMIVTVLIDIVLNPLLIRGLGPVPAFGIAGSAAATATANLAGLIGIIVWIYARDLPLRLRGAELRWLIPQRAELGYILRKGLPMGAQMLIISGAGILMIGLVNREGLLTAAAFSASLQLFNYVQMPALAIGAAVSAMAAQNIGALRHDRVSQATRAGITLNLVMTGTIIALLLVLDRAVLGLFLGNASPAVPLARHIMLLASWSFLLFGVMIVMFSTMRAYGAVIAPLIILGVALYPVRLGFYYLAYPRLGADAIWLSFPAGAVVPLGLTLAFYLRGPWQKQMAAGSAGSVRPVGAVRPAA